MGSHRRRSRGGASSTLALVVLLGLAALAGLWAVSRLSLPALEGGRIPVVAYDAYRAASGAARTVAPGCAVDWTVLGGIAQVESSHGRHGEDHVLASNGDVRPEIRGAALDGTRGTQRVVDTDGGALDGDDRWDRAVGPLQFIPSTWRELARDGNGDGVADPDNLYDASLTAVAHLCIREPGDYSDRGQLRRALLAYNPSRRYADLVLRWIDRYSTEPLADVIESPEPGA